MSTAEIFADEDENARRGPPAPATPARPGTFPAATPNADGNSNGAANGARRDARAAGDDPHIAETLAGDPEQTAAGPSPSPLVGPVPAAPSPAGPAAVATVQRSVDHLDLLESHAVFIMREVAAESERPVLLFSGGKDSAVLLHLAAKAFRPGGFPFPVLQVDTGHNFPEVLAYRDKQVADLGERLIVASVQESIDRGRVADPGPNASRNRLQSTTLLDAITTHRFDAAIGGARRDEDKARAKERVLSFRDPFGQWDPKRQRPELWQLYQGRVQPGEHLRAFPLSDWTELDVWQYIGREHIELPHIYFAHRRAVVERDGMLLAVSEWVNPGEGETAEEETVRFRTVGDATCTGAVRSEARTVEQIITEIASSRVSERGATRADDRFSETAMEDRKREGYF
jgi:sulfate adenylyltransferase subunit 2